MEERRNNLVVSRETKRHDKATEKLTRQANKEQGRHNLVTEANQLQGYQTDLARSKIAAEASKYGADSSAAASRYAADSSAAASKYAADKAAQTAIKSTKIKAGADKQIAWYKTQMDKIINDDKLNSQEKIARAKNSSDQFIARLNRELEKYKANLSNDTKLKQLENELIIALSKEGANLKTAAIVKILSKIESYIEKKLK